jgi:hypothetical protein
VTRRGVLLAGAAAAVTPAAVLAKPPSDQQQARAKAALLATLVLEQTAVVAYEAIANGGSLPAHATALLRQFRDQDARHAAQLSLALDALGVKAPIPPDRARIAGLAAARGVQGATRFAIDLEQRTVAAYARAVTVVSDANVLRSSVGAMGANGQQLVVFRQLAGIAPVPSAFAAVGPG